MRFTLTLCVKVFLYFFEELKKKDSNMKKPLIGADLILSLGFIAYLYFDIKSDGDGSFLKGLKEMTSDVVFWYIVLALIIFAPIAILYAKKLKKTKKR